LTTIQVGSGQQLSLSVLSDRNGITGREQLQFCWIAMTGAVNAEPQVIWSGWQRANLERPNDLMIVNGPVTNEADQPIGLLCRRSRTERGRLPVLVPLQKGGFLIQAPTGSSIRPWHSPGSIEDALAVIQSDLLLVDELRTLLPSE
jgi:hypothetical protein